MFVLARQPSTVWGLCWCNFLKLGDRFMSWFKGVLQKDNQTICGVQIPHHTVDGCEINFVPLDRIIESFQGLLGAAKWTSQPSTVRHPGKNNNAKSGVQIQHAIQRFPLLGYPYHSIDPVERGLLFEPWRFEFPAAPVQLPRQRGCCCIRLSDFGCEVKKHLGCEIGSPAKSLTFSGLIWKNPLDGKQLKS